MPGKNESLSKPGWTKLTSLTDENYPVTSKPKKDEVSKPLLNVKKVPLRLKDTPAELGDFCNRAEDDKLKEFFSSEYSLDLGKPELQPVPPTRSNSHADEDEVDFNLIKEDSINSMLDDLCLNLTTPNISEIQDPILDLDEVLGSCEIDTFSREPENFDSFFNSHYDLGEKELEPEFYSDSDFMKNEYARILDEPVDLDKTLEAEKENVAFENEVVECVGQLEQQLYDDLELIDVCELMNI